VGGDIVRGPGGELVTAAAGDGLSILGRDLNMPRRRLALRSGVIFEFAR
jgi:hypothetical protein